MGSLVTKVFKCNGLCNIISVEYPSYPEHVELNGRSIKPSFHAIVDDCIKLINTINEKPHDDQHKVIMWGRSLGTALAVHLTRVLRADGLIIESGFVTPMLIFFPWDFGICDYNNGRDIAYIDCPVQIFHGTSDPVIPWTHSQLLWSKVKNLYGKRLFEGKGHNNIDEGNTGKEVRETIVTMIREIVFGVNEQLDYV